MEAKHKKKMDPVDADELDGDHEDREDKDIDNDGDEDKSDEYLHKRRKAVSKATKEAYTKPTKAEIEADKKKDQKGKPRPSMNAKSAKKAAYGNMMGGLKNEEVENLDELSKKTLGSYIKKAASDVGYNAETSNTKKELKRHKGIAKAADKLTKEDVQWPVYKRIMEKTKQPNDSGIPAQPADDIASKGAKDFMAQHGDRKPEDYVDVDKVLDMNKQDMYRNLPNKSKGRPNDQKVGQPSADKSNGKDKL